MKTYRVGAIVLLTSLIVTSPRATGSPATRASATAGDGDDNALLDAVRSEDLSRVRECLQRGAHLNATDWHGRTAAFLAANNGNVPILDDLIAHGADINIASRGRWGTPLCIAIANRRDAAVQALLKAGADPATKGPSGTSSLHAAAWAGNLGLVKAFSDRGVRWDERASCDGTPIHEAADAGQIEVLKYFLDHGADVNARADAEFTPLMVAALTDQKDAVIFLLDRGADANAVNSDGRTALQLAERRQSQDSIKVLRDHAKRRRR